MMRCGEWMGSLTVGMVALVLLPSAAVAEVKLPPVLSSHMVLQRERQVPIWGTATPGEKVTVRFRDQEKTTQADAQGKWLLNLDALRAGGPDPLTVAGDKTSKDLKLDDVLVGEVWVGSGQSNMAGSVSSYAKSDAVLAKLAAGSYPRLRLMGSGRSGWSLATPTTNPGYSALLFAFGVRLQEALDVPVGLIVGAVGGTPSGYWLSEEMLVADAPSQQSIKAFAATYDLEQQKAKHQTALLLWAKAVEQAKKDGKKAPNRPLAPVKPGEMSNGKIGQLFDRHIKPFIPFAIRGVVWDQGESGTQVLGLDQYTLMGALIRGWRNVWGLGEVPFIFIQKPSGGGPAWDHADAVTSQADKFSTLPAAVPPLQAGAYRENHIRIMTYPNTGMAITSDLGPGIHPINKSGYGTRASRVALGMVYGKKIEYYGPIYQGHKVEGNKIRITYTHVGQGLASRHGDRLQGFAVAGPDRTFVWAEAEIDGNTVVVSSPKVSTPVAVRYAWSQTHPWANLFNRDGLPAVSFRTDSWEK